MILSNIKQFFSRNKKIFYYLGFIFVVFMLSGEWTFANDEPGHTDVATTSNETLDTAISVVEGLLKGVSAILALLTYLVTLFLDPSWINGTVFGLDEHFRKIWILVSNMVYFIFAFILIWIAFMNIIGKGGDKYQLKQALPKFVIGVLIVPFSWFIVQFVLSISAILTVSALTLPYDSFSDFQSRLGDVNIKKNCTINLASITTEKKEGAKDQGLIVCDTPIPLKQVFESDQVSNSIFGTISTYTFGIISIDTLDDVSAESLKKGIKTIGDLVVKVVIDFLFVLIYAILIIALGLVLLVRGIYLWIYVMLSPLFGLMYFFDKTDGGGDGFFGKFNIKEFFALAMVPVYSMLALSFGLLFLFVIGTGLTNSDKLNTFSLASSSDDKKGSFVIGDKDSTSFTLQIKGSIGGSSEDVAKGAYNLFADTGNGAMGVIGTLIIQLFGIVILWGTIMAALRSSEITKAIVEPIHSFGNQVGGIIAKSPQYAPIFGGQSMQSMQKIGSSVQGHFETKASSKASKFLDKTPFGDSAKTQDELNKIISNARLKSDTSPNRLVNDLRTILASAKGDIDKLYTEPRYQEALFEMGKVTIGADAMKNMKITNPESIDGIGKLTSLLSKIDGDHKYNALYAGVTNLAAGDTDKVKELVKELGKDNAEVNVNQEGSSASIERTSKISDSTGKYIIDFNINGQSITGTTGDSGSVESFRGEDYKKIADYISKKVSGEEQFSKMLDLLDVTSDKKVRSTMKNEIGKFFNDDGEVALANTDGKGENLSKYLNKNNKAK